MDEIATCRTCSEVRPTSQMEKRKRADGSLAYDRCHECLRKKNQIYKKTERGYLVKLIQGSRNSSVRRAAVRKIPAAHTLTVHHVIQKLNAQNRRCAISGIPMKTARECSWQLSIERVDDTKDYSDENCTLICLEFQSGSQWTKQKFIHAFTHTDTVDHDVVGEASILEFITAEPFRNKRQKKIMDKIRHYKCYGCALWLLEKDFKPRRAGEVLCLSCAQAYNYAKARPWTNKFKSLVKASVQSTSTRNKRGRNMEGKITTEELREIFIDQQGLCAYSGLRLQLTGDWKASLERIDPTLGYYPWNVCLIAFEFNSTDRRAFNTDAENTAGTNWSKEKYDAVRAAYHTDTLGSLDINV